MSDDQRGAQRSAAVANGHGESTPNRQHEDSWIRGESAENGEIIATEPRDIAESADEAANSEGRPAGDVFGMKSDAHGADADDE